MSATTSADDVIELPRLQRVSARLDADQEQCLAETNPDQGTTRRVESARKRARVLIGAALSQLPIWGFAMSYGVFQEYYTESAVVQGTPSTLGVVGTTSNGVMYLAMPFLFGAFTRLLARHRQAAAYFGAAVACASFFLSSFSTEVWHLVATQGVLVALGCAFLYSPTTLSLGEWFSTSNRAVAYGVTLSCKNIVGSACPFLFRALLDQYGFRTTLRIWAAVTLVSGAVAAALIPPHPSRMQPTAPGRRSGRAIPWSFLKHAAFYVYGTAIVLQSAGYGIPQTYLNTYAHDVALVSQASATLLLTLFNVPGIASSAFFGYLSDNKHVRLSAAAVTALSATASALSTFVFWGLADRSDSMALLVLFAVTFGFFAGGYSGGWGGIVNELEQEAAQHNEAIDTGMVYGLLNGARGIGYVAGGLVGVPLKASDGLPGALAAYGTSYGPLILFTGLSVALGGGAFAWKTCGRLQERISRYRGSQHGRWLRAL